MSNFTARVVRYQLAEQVTIYVRHQLAEICQPSAVGSQLFFNQKLVRLMDWDLFAPAALPITLTVGICSAKIV